MTIHPTFEVVNNKDFLDLTFQLTPESIKLFNLGSPGQGYCLLIDVETGDIYLRPAFNRNDGLLINDKNNQQFESAYTAFPYTISKDPPTKAGGDLHGKTSSSIWDKKNNSFLQAKAGNRGKLMGGGLWKAGCNVRFIDMSTLSKPKAGAVPTYPVPDTYIVAKDSTGWKIFYVNKFFHIRPIEIPDLKSRLLQIKDMSVADLNRQDHGAHDFTVPKLNEVRQNIEDIIMKHHKNMKLKSDDPVQDENDIKSFKTASTSQNGNSIKRDEDFMTFFEKSNPHDSLDAGNVMHANLVIRELPEKIVTKVVKAIWKDLKIHDNMTIDQIMNNHILPIAYSEHILTERRWQNFSVSINNMLEKLEDGNINEKNVDIIKNNLIQIFTARAIANPSGCEGELVQIIKHLEALLLELHKNKDLASYQEIVNKTSDFNFLTNELSEKFAKLHNNDQLTPLMPSSPISSSTNITLSQAIEQKIGKKIKQKHKLHAKMHHKNKHAELHQHNQKHEEKHHSARAQLCLMSNLPNNDPNQAVTGMLYISVNREYVVRDQNGIVHQDTLPSNLDMEGLENKLNELKFLHDVLKITSSRGHTDFENTSKIKHK